MTNTCDTCKWWGKEPELVSTHHECLNEKIRSYDEDGALIPNECSINGGYGFIPGPKFGCIHHDLTPVGDGAAPAAGTATGAAPTT